MDRRTAARPRSTEEGNLLSAVLELVSELRRDEAMRRVVRTATALAGARRGALAVLDLRDCVVEVVELGSDTDDLPLATPLLDRPPLGLLTTPIAADTLSAPAPPAPGAVALGVPIRSRRGFRANLYTADKMGGGVFTESDETLLVLFAAVAGAVIDNSKLYEEGQQRELWVALQSQIATSLLAGVGMEEVLDLVASGARELTASDWSTVLLYDGSSSLTLQAADGPEMRRLVGTTIPTEGTISGRIIENGEPVLVADASDVAHTDEPLLTLKRIGGAIFVPLLADGHTLGTLAVGRVDGRPPLTQTDFWLLESFASQVSIALEYGRTRTELQRLAVLDDQERIARDLHDTVIQQLFATGMFLQATAGRMTDPAATDRVHQAIDMLDGIIADIRSTVFALGSQARQSGSMRVALQALAEQVFEPSEIVARMHFEGPVDTAIGPEAGQHLVATLREALSNVSRHARATTVDVYLHVGDEVVLRVVDDGVGVGTGPRRLSGLRNLGARARAMGGDLKVTDAPSGGTVLEWRIPQLRPTGSD